MSMYPVIFQRYPSQLRIPVIPERNVCSIGAYDWPWGGGLLIHIVYSVVFGIVMLDRL